MQHDARKWAKLIIIIIIIIIIFLFFVTLQVRFLEDRGSSEVKASRLYIYSGIASLLVRPVIGRVNDLTWVNPCYIYTVAAALEGVFTILLPFASTQFHFVIYFVFYGLADGTVGCGINIAILNGLPERLKHWDLAFIIVCHVSLQLVVRLLEVYIFKMSYVVSKRPTDLKLM